MHRRVPFIYGFMLFLHLGGLAIWLGSIFTTHPSSFLVLLSGIFMLVELGMDNHDSFKKTMKRIHNATANPAAAHKSIRAFVASALILVVWCL